MFKKLILLLFIVAPISIFAQDKIAYINSQEIFSKMPELKDVETQLATERQTITTRRDAILKEYNDLVEKLQKDTTALSESILLDRQNQVASLEKRYQDYMQTSAAEFEKKQQTLLEPLEQKMRKAIKDVGDENSYLYILDSGSLLYVGNTAIDANKFVKTKLGIVD